MSNIVYSAIQNFSFKPVLNFDKKIKSSNMVMLHMNNNCNYFESYGSMSSSALASLSLFV